jgi:hypothetical protein
VLTPGGLEVDARLRNNADAPARAALSLLLADDRGVPLAVRDARDREHLPGGADSEPLHRVVALPEPGFYQAVVEWAAISEGPGGSATGTGRFALHFEVTGELELVAMTQGDWLEFSRANLAHEGGSR